MRALVTGANGLIGANLVRDLLERGIRVRGLVRESSDLAALAGLDIELHRADIRSDTRALDKAAAGCSVVFHTALHFTYDRRRARNLDAAALTGTENVLHAAHKAGVRRVVLTSSSVVFGFATAPAAADESGGPASIGDDNPYVAAKIRQHARAMELGAQLGLEVVAVCPTVSVGPHGTNLGPSNGMIIAYLADPNRATFPGGCNIVSTADVAAGHWLAAQRGQPGACYILGSQNLEWRRLHAMIAELAGVEPPRVVLNHSLAYLAATAEEIGARLAHRAPLVNRDQAAMIGRYYWYEHTAAGALGYRPRPARLAVAEALSWLSMSAHVNRELRTTLRLHDDVYAVRHSETDPMKRLPRMVL